MPEPALPARFDAMTPPERIEVRPAAYDDVAPMREGYRREARCQIVHDSILPRGLATPYLLTCGARVAGYGGVWNRYHHGRLMEFYAAPGWREQSVALYHALIRAGGVTRLEAQSNMPAMDELLTRFAVDITTEKLLFEDGPRTSLRGAGLEFRERREGDAGPDGEWVVEYGGEVVGAGGVLTHYNPPYGDLYMEVVEDKRRRGIGSYLVQELRRMARSKGVVPAARCDPDNTASRRTLLRGGLVECGRLRVGNANEELLGRNP